MSAEPKQDLAALIAGDGITTREQAGVAADAVIAAGWMSPEEHHETLNDYGQTVGDLNLANYRIARVEALAEWLASRAGILTTRGAAALQIRAALAEPERDEEGGR